MHELAFTNPNYYSYPSIADSASPTPGFPYALATPAPQEQALIQHYRGHQDPAFARPDGVNYYTSPPLSTPVYQQQQQHQPYAATFVEQPPQAFASPELTSRQSASPAPHLSPNVRGQRQNVNHSFTPPTHFTMAAPPLPPSPANAQAPNQAAAPTPPAPQSPSAAPTGREAQRMTLLLEINQELLSEVQRLQGDDQGGATSVQHQMQLRQAGQSDKMASDAYVQLLRRLQGNLAYMMPRSGQQPTNPDARIIAGPAFMQHPPQMPQLAERYARLRELFPEWVGNDAKLMAMSAAGGAASPTQAASMQRQRQMQQFQQQQQQQFQQKQQQQQQQQQQPNANGFGPNMMQ